MKKYIEVMDHIRPTDVQKNRCLKMLFTKQTKKKDISI